MAFLNNIFRSKHKEPNVLDPQELAMWNRVELALGRVRPMLQSDGGDIELIKVSESSVTVRLIGACSHCSSSTITMQEGVERVLRDEIPELTEITLV